MAPNWGTLLSPVIGALPSQTIHSASHPNAYLTDAVAVGAALRMGGAVRVLGALEGATFWGGGQSSPVAQSLGSEHAAPNFPLLSFEHAETASAKSTTISTTSTAFAHLIAVIMSWAGYRSLQRVANTSTKQRR